MHRSTLFPHPHQPVPAIGPIRAWELAAGRRARHGPNGCLELAVSSGPGLGPWDCLRAGSNSRAAICETGCFADKHHSLLRRAWASAGLLLSPAVRRGAARPRVPAIPRAAVARGQFLQFVLLSLGKLSGHVATVLQVAGATQDLQLNEPDQFQFGQTRLADFGLLGRRLLIRFGFGSFSRTGFAPRQGSQQILQEIKCLAFHLERRFIELAFRESFAEPDSSVGLPIRAPWHIRRIPEYDVPNRRHLSPNQLVLSQVPVRRQ